MSRSKRRRCEIGGTVGGFALSEDGYYCLPINNLRFFSIKDLFESLGNRNIIVFTRDSMS